MMEKLDWRWWLGLGRRGTGDGSEGVITAVSTDEVLGGGLAGLATEVSRAVW